jgi:rSAM/selenodomain-associated transferase 2
VARVAGLLLSIVIPVRHDGEALARLLSQVPPQPDVQIIVTATAEHDEHLSRLQLARPDVLWVRGPAGRGVQMNAGAARASGQWLWFVHADSGLPERFVEVFRRLGVGVGEEPGPSAADATPIVGGSFRFTLDSRSWQARLWERGVALRVRLLGLPYGDQGLFVRRTVFVRMGGFKPMPLMEDVEFVGRLKRQGRIRHLNHQLLTSARRWEREGWWRRTRRNLGLLALYYMGVSPERLARRYERTGP